MDLTDRQQAVFDFLKDYRSRFRRSPSYEEIRRHFGFGSLNSVRKHLQQLERKGYIRTPWANQKRAVEIVPDKLDPPPGAHKIPVLGSLTGRGFIDAAGTPESVEVPESLLGRGEHFALRVGDDTMADDGIFKGDVLVIQGRQDARPGEVVLALVDGDVTVNRYERSGQRIELRSARPSSASRIFDESQVQIQGVCVALVRRYT